MNFSLKGMLVLAAFVAALMLAVSARAGKIDPALAVVGIAAIVVIDGVVTFVPLLLGRMRSK